VIWIWYFVAIVSAEVAVIAYAPIGMGVHLVLLFAIAIHASFGDVKDRPLLVSLMLVPLIRVVSLSLPLARVPILYWYVLTSIPLFVAAGVTIRVLRLTRHEVGLRPANALGQLSIGLVGFPLGVIEYVILRPSSLVTSGTALEYLTVAAVFLLCTGLLEELIFRGILQTTAARVIGRRSVLYVSAIFAALHVGYLSGIDVAFVFGVGLLFGYLVRRTGSVLGVSLAHGLTNLALFAIIPRLLGG
jgi:membrane protease YdiL (CAAX protease family)